MTPKQSLKAARQFVTQQGGTLAGAKDTPRPCPCDNLSARKPGYKLCPTCLQIAQGNGMDIELWRE